MDKKRVWLVALAVLSLLIAASLACGPSAPTTAPTETPVLAETPEAVETPEVAETPEVVETPEAEEPFAMEENALNDLDSYAYHYSWKFKFVTEGELQSGSWEGDGEIQNKPTKAMHIVYNLKNEETTYMESVYIEEEAKMWMRTEEGGEWLEIPAEDSSAMETFTLLGLWATVSPGAEGTSFVGLEVVNGIPTRHYKATAFSGISAGCTFATAEQNWWVAVTGNYPVKGSIDASGTCEGESIEYHFLEEISNVNQPMDISPPM